VTRGLAVAVLAALFAVGCAAGGNAPELTGAQAQDAALQTGSRVYQDRCARCHGRGGGGGAGPALADGRVVRRFANPDDEAAVIRNGRGAMPAWAQVLTPAEIDAVVRYTREVL
jgi:mono/diheme cytochrome c family protein